MNYPAIYHRPESEMAYLLDSETIQIRLKAAKNDLKQVQILAGDPYALNNPHFKRPHPQTITKKHYQTFGLPFHTRRPNR